MDTTVAPEHGKYDYDKLIAESTGHYRDWWMLLSTESVVELTFEMATDSIDFSHSIVYNEGVYRVTGRTFRNT